MRPATLHLLLLIAVTGCAQDVGKLQSLPPVQWNDPSDALARLRDGVATVQTASARGTITFVRAGDGQSVRMDLAMVAQPPHHLRLRAWKLGRAIFDLTLAPDGIWLLSPDDPSLRQKADKAGMGAGEIARHWSTLAGGFFSRADLKFHRQRDALIFEAPQGDLRLRCRVDGRTLVPLEYQLENASDHVHFSLKFEQYRMLGDIPYAHRLQASSSHGRILILFSEVELNEPLAPGAFVPPRRAEKLP